MKGWGNSKLLTSTCFAPFVVIILEKAGRQKICSFVSRTTSLTLYHWNSLSLSIYLYICLFQRQRDNCRRGVESCVGRMDTVSYLPSTSSFPVWLVIAESRATSSQRLHLGLYYVMIPSILVIFQCLPKHIGRKWNGIKQSWLQSKFWYCIKSSSLIHCNDVILHSKKLSNFYFIFILYKSCSLHSSYVFLHSKRNLFIIRFLTPVESAKNVKAYWF